MSLVDASFKLRRSDLRFPVALTTYLGELAPEPLSVRGNLEILQRKTLALFCSVQCPGKLIVQTYDLAHKLRRAGVIVIGGFHSPMERKCLAILLQSPHPVVVCSARSLPKPSANRPVNFSNGLSCSTCSMAAQFQRAHISRV